MECNPLLYELPTVSKTVKSIKLLSSGKVPGSDAIPAEIYKAGGPPVAEKLTELFHIMWRKEAIPQKFKDATIIHLFKRKGNPQEKCQEQNVDLYLTFVDLTKAFGTVSCEGLWKIMAKFGCPAKFITMVRQVHDRNWQSYFTLCGEKKPSLKNSRMQQLFKRKGNPQVCDNHRGISLLSIAGKILARVLLNRLNEHLEQSGLLPESQCGFRKNRGTIDMIFTARQPQEKCQEQNVNLYMTFVDHTKAFDTVSREGLWKCMAKFGCPAKFIAMVRPLHDGMLARVQNDGEFSDPFPVTNGMKQGCVLASTLFSMMFFALLTDAFQDGDNGIPIRYRFDGKLFNLRRLQAKSKVQTEVLDEFFFVDDMAKGAPTEEKMQKKVWIKYLIHVTAVIAQSASKRLR